MDLLYSNSFGIYIHIPFCRRRCIYCDFYFEIGKSQANFHEHLLQEWRFRQNFWPKNPQTLYFGGGTPSLLTPTQIEALVQSIAPHAQEITLEANPEDLNPEYLTQIKHAGVNRLSLGVQSLEDPILKYLGRKHQGNQAKQAIIQAKQAGFERISVDLIAGVSGENLEAATTWFRDQHIGHLSIYLLTVEAMTPLDRLIQKGRLKAPCEDQQTEAYITLQERLTGLGYEQYEVSSYALPGQESQHNRIYWSKGIYLGLGPGAHSMQLHLNGSITRRHTYAKLAEWQKDPTQATFQEEILTPEEALREALAFGLRDLQAGIDPKALAARHQVALPAGFHELMARFEQDGWVRSFSKPHPQPFSSNWRGEKFHMTPTGARFADAIAREILALTSPPVAL